MRTGTTDVAAAYGLAGKPFVVVLVGRFAGSAPAQKGLALLHRFGPVAVMLAHLTVGVQTAVFAGSGLIRMPYGRFTVASVPGAVGWALIWATVGLGAVWAALALATRSPWALAGVLAALAAAVAALVVRARRRRAAAASPRAADSPPA